MAVTVKICAHKQHSSRSPAAHLKLSCTHYASFCCISAPTMMCMICILCVCVCVCVCVVFTGDVGCMLRVLYLLNEELEAVKLQSTFAEVMKLICDKLRDVWRPVAAPGAADSPVAQVGFTFYSSVYCVINLCFFSFLLVVRAVNALTLRETCTA